MFAQPEEFHVRAVFAEIRISRNHFRAIKTKKFSLVKIQKAI